MKKARKIIIIFVILALVIAGVVATLSVIKKNNKNKKEVTVVPVSSMSSNPSDYGMGDTTFSGNVKVSMAQKVYITSSTKIDEIYVTVGQAVKKGDVLLKYDVTAQQLELESKKASVDLAKNQVTSLERDLKRLQETTPIEDQPKPPVQEPPSTEAPVQTPPTTEAPVVEPPTTEAPQVPADNQESVGKDTSADGSSESETQNPEVDGTTGEGENSTEGTTTETPTTEAPTTETPTTQAPTTQAPTTEAPVDNNSEQEFDDVGNGEIQYTREELDKAITDKKNQIRDAKVAADLEEISYEMLQAQNASPELLCNFDGVVTNIESEETAINENKPFITVSSNEGITVEAYVGEYSLSSVKPGTELSMYCYDSGMSYTGTVTDIGKVPADNYDSWGATQSYYPVEISVPDAGDLTQGMYMEISMPSVYDDMSTDTDAQMMQQSDTFTIPIQFLKKENGKRYVMKEKDGRLVKSYVSTGRIFWGSEIEILGGLSQNDFVAFPYLADAVEGTRTKEGTLEEMYGY